MRIRILFPLDADPDQAFDFDVDPDLPKMMRIRIHNTA